eukprot:CAMPEP_0195284856 /NCGR_PEP_ID=MMETSP0707-20130614/2904_1 /TAXON_ID=33640 /ORGANISM="Asterionellopsis glacialis, Strain CCMP134" /LENGTH=445 /DNA_ID=CAMNT_0040344257 /DNA_START=69 /DNA_END=1406 /DNA_ORIENTATION=-
MIAPVRVLQMATRRRINKILVCSLKTSLKRQRQSGFSSIAFGSRNNDNDHNKENSVKEGNLILVRHGQSTWNVTDPVHNTTARFTGWTDVQLTDLGKQQAKSAGRALATYHNDNCCDEGYSSFPIDCAVSSLLQRSKDTLDIMLEEMNLKEENNQDDYKIPLIYSWRLNERHYGSLVGLSKVDAEDVYSASNLKKWRHGWDSRPPPMDKETRMEWSKQEHCQCITIVKDRSSNTHTTATAARQHGNNHQNSNNPNRSTKMVEKRIASSLSSNSNKATISTRMIPASESLKDTCERVIPLWKSALAPRLVRGETILLVAHANTVKSLLSLLDPTVVTGTSFSKLKIPSATPLLYRFRPTPEQQCQTTTGDETEHGVHENDHVLPGGLVLVKPSTSKNNNSKIRMIDDNVHEEFRNQLHGEWIQTKDIEHNSFCTPEGEHHLEHEIA